ncbi:MAG: protein-glutamate O-methyltransferase CheR [Lachnospira sp.]|nr:protein-glutamate O-methyltransferase CheR [Lachnospira sp.]
MLGSYEEFKADILRYSGIDLNSYKEQQMKRRLDTLITRKGYGGYSGYFQAIKTQKDVYDEFLSYMTINISEFFRNPTQWGVLENLVLPELMKNTTAPLKIWSAACSTGDEPYTLVMLLSKYIPLNKIKIHATDIDTKIIEAAKAGVYQANSVKNVPKDLLDKHFTKLNENTYRINDNIKQAVEFRRHDLLADKYQEGYDLIVCRNVLIYFTEEAKENIYAKFSQSLKSGGYLFIGSTEQIMKYREFDFTSHKSFFYRKN